MTTPAATKPERIYAGYFVVQAVAGVALWLSFVGSATVRGWFELMPDQHAVMDAFVFADAVIVLGSLVSARLLWTDAPSSVAATAFTAGGIVYPTLYLVGWLAFTGSGGLCLAIMIPPTILTLWIAWQTWRTHR